MMGTRIQKIDAEMAEKIEVEVGTFDTEINFLPICHFPNEDEDSETPPNINFLLSFGQENSRKQSGTKTAFLN